MNLSFVFSSEFPEAKSLKMGVSNLPTATSYILINFGCAHTVLQFEITI